MVEYVIAAALLALSVLFSVLLVAAFCRTKISLRTDSNRLERNDSINSNSSLVFIPQYPSNLCNNSGLSTKKLGLYGNETDVEESVPVPPEILGCNPPASSFFLRLG